jgi:hypothetical protein
VRRVLVVLLVALVALVVAPSAVPQQPEPVPLNCEVFATGQSYGTEHVAPAAIAGAFPEDHVPGQHVGFSTCVP